MAHEYCECNSGLGSFDCSCAGLSYPCQCDSYGGGGPLAQYTYDNFTKAGCPSLIFTPPNTYKSSDVSTLYSLLSNKIKTGEIIYAEDIEELWITFMSLIETKRNYNYVGIAPNYNYSKPNIAPEDIIEADHFEHLKDNIYTAHHDIPALNDNTGNGFRAPNGITYRSTSGAATTEYLTDHVIFASKVSKLAKWIGASLYQCVCNHNVQVKCCSCNIVCDCNY